MAALAKINFSRDYSSNQLINSNFKKAMTIEKGEMLMPNAFSEDEGIIGCQPAGKRSKATTSYHIIYLLY